MVQKPYAYGLSKASSPSDSTSSGSSAIKGKTGKIFSVGGGGGSGKSSRRLKFKPTQCIGGKCWMYLVESMLHPFGSQDTQSLKNRCRETQRHPQIIEKNNKYFIGLGHATMSLLPLPPPPLPPHSSPSTKGMQLTSGDVCCCVLHNRQVPSALHDSRRLSEGCIARSHTASVCPARAL